VGLFTRPQSNKHYALYCRVKSEPGIASGLLRDYIAFMIEKLIRFLRPQADPREKCRALYNACVTAARAPHWYAQGGVPDTIDGRFDMLAAMVTITLLRLEREPAYIPDSVYLTEIFIADMDEQLRQIGIGDVGIAKQVGRIMSAMGGRLTVYRTALAADAPVGAFADALVRNVWRGEPSEDAKPDWVAAHLRTLHLALEDISAAKLITGAWPKD
jgi:cytochrome b pre-mRNA-processing protein 3